MRHDGLSVTAMMALAAFAVERVTTGILFLLSCWGVWRAEYPDPDRLTDPEKIGVARSWRVSYAKQAELLEAQGNFIDARQARIKVQQLDDVINVMQLQLQAEADGRYIPLHKVLSSSHHKAREHHEEEN